MKKFSLLYMAKLGFTDIALISIYLLKQNKKKIR